MHNPVRPDEWVLFEGLQPCRMLELGNKKNSASGITYKAFFEAQGFDHTSVDWNGLDGALKKDLREPLGLGEFDLVTNIGTTEHVDGQPEVWRNIHEAIKVGGYLISVTPKADGKNWRHHGLFYPKHEFYEVFATVNGYHIERLYDGNPAPASNTYCRMTKLHNSDFRMPDMGFFYVNNSGLHS